ncbi:MAG: DUF5706 domain-containing protein [Gemmatimonadota bacterium]
MADDTRPVDAASEDNLQVPEETGAPLDPPGATGAVRSGSTNAGESSSPGSQEPRGIQGERPPAEILQAEAPSTEKPKKKKKKKGKKKGGSARGVETMYRTSYRTHLDLSALADNKANIMISINGIIISILLGTGVGALGQIGVQPDFLLPTAVLLVFCLLSLVWAVLAARPRVTRRETTLEEVRDGKANILFFGNFTSLPEEDFVEGMDELVKDPQRTYTNMTRDIYGLGSVLETKYRLLRVSYTLFMVGLILGVGLFLVAFIRGAMSGPGF